MLRGVLRVKKILAPGKVAVPGLCPIVLNQVVNVVVGFERCEVVGVRELIEVTCLLYTSDAADE